MSTSKKNSKPSIPKFKRSHILYENIADISTSHITATDGQLILTQGAPNLAYIVAGCHGSMFHLPHICEGHAEWVAAAARYGFSDAFVSLCLQLARADFHYVYFDGDGPVYKDVQQFIW
jgi:hypothetical protein